MTAGAAFQKLMQKLKEEQEIVMDIADMIALVFTAESALLRAEKIQSMKGEAEAALYVAMARVYLSDALEKVNVHGKHALAAFTEGDEQRIMLMGLKRYTKMDVVNTKALRREIAAKIIDANQYPF